MFYKYVENEWKKGNVSVGLSADSSDKQVSIEAKGFAQIALSFLSHDERQMLGELSKSSAKHSPTYPSH